jgi:hypothetical protein
MTAVVVLLALVVALLAVLVVGLLRSHAEILRELHALKQGRVSAIDAPSLPPSAGPPLSERSDGRVIDIVGTDPAGDAIHVGVLGAPHRTLLAFLSSGCLTCRDLWQAFGTTRVPEGIRSVIVTRGPAEESPSGIAALAPAEVPVVMSAEAWSTYDVPVVPYFVLVDGSSGRIVGEGTGASWDQVRTMMSQALEDDAARRRGATGDRDARVDLDLAAAGIGPGHPSLHAESSDDDRVDEDAPA